MKFIRKELYEEIWKISVSGVAKKYDIPSQLIKKKCIEFNIPLPTLKYWGDFYAGKNPIQVSLPEHFVSDEIVIEKKVQKIDVIQKKIEKKLTTNVDVTTNPINELENGPINSGFSQTESSTDVNEEIRKLFQGYDEITTSKLCKAYLSMEAYDKLRKPHIEIVRHKEGVKKKRLEARKNRYGFANWDQGENYVRDYYLSISSVSDETMPRVYLILDVLIKSIENCGGIIKYKDNHAFFFINGEWIIFRVREKNSRRNIPENERGRYGNTFENVPSGLLKFTIGYESVRGRGYGEHIKEIDETKTITQDKLLRKLFVSIFDQPAQKKQDREKYEIEQEYRRFEEEERYRVREIRNNEIEKTNELIKNAKLFALANDLYRYIDHIQHNENEIMCEYLEWALKKARWIDPTQNQQDDILKETDKENL